MSATTEHIAVERGLSDAIVFDATPVRSQWCRRRIEGLLEGLSLTRSDGVWQSLLEAPERLPLERAVVVGDLHEITSRLTLDQLVTGPPRLTYVLLVRTALDGRRLADPDMTLWLNDERLFVVDLRDAAKAGQSAELEFLHVFFRRFVERLQPDRVQAARFSAIDGVLWIEFGDGLQRAVRWNELPFARQIRFAPVSASARELGQAIRLTDAEGRDVDIDAGSLRSLVDPAHLDRLEEEDQRRRAQMGRRLRRVREQRGLSQEQVAERSGVAQESLSRIETGRRDPRLATLRRLAKGLDLSLSELLASISSQE